MGPLRSTRFTGTDERTHPRHPLADSPPRCPRDIDDGEDRLDANSLASVFSVMPPVGMDRIIAYGAASALTVFKSPNLSAGRNLTTLRPWPSTASNSLGVMQPGETLNHTPPSPASRPRRRRSGTSPCNRQPADDERVRQRCRVLERVERDHEDDGTLRNLIGGGFDHRVMSSIAETRRRHRNEPVSISPRLRGEDSAGVRQSFNASCSFFFVSPLMMLFLPKPGSAPKPTACSCTSA